MSMRSICKTVMRTLLMLAAVTMVTVTMVLTQAIGQDGAMLADSSWVERLKGDDVRLWLDSTGMHVIEARLAGKSGDSVALKRLDGQTMSIPVNRLSRGDQQFIAASGGAAEQDSAEESPSPAKIPSTVRQFLSVQVDRVTSSASARDKTVNGVPWLSAMLPSSANPQPLAMDRSGKFVIVTSDGPGEDARSTGPSTSVVFDVENNVAVATIQWPATVRVLDYDPLSDLLLVGTLLPGVSTSRYSSTKKPEYSFLVAMAGLRSFRLAGIGYVDAAFFLRPEEIFATRSNYGNNNEMFSGGAVLGDRMLVHKFDRMCGVIIGQSKPLWSYPLVNEGTIAVSPDRRFFAASDNEVIGVVDASTGKMIRTLQTGDGQVRTILSFSTNGRQLAAIYSTRIEVWDLASSNRIAESSHKNVTGNLLPTAMTWIDNDNILLDRKWLYNLKTQNFIWEYSSINAVVTSRGWTMVDSHTDSAQLVAFDLPHSPASAAIADLATQPQAVVVDSSSPMQVLVDATPDLYNKLEKIATEVGKRSGWNLQKKADVSLIARVKQEPEPIEISVTTFATRTIDVGPPSGFGGSSGLGQFFPPSFRPPTFGPRSIQVPSRETPRPPRKIKFQPYYCELEIRKDGESVWNWRNGWRPGGSVSSPDTESEADLIKRLSVPNIEGMRTVFIPRRIVDEDDLIELGKSQLTDSGIVEH
ncbi:hypothetical protein Poly51_56100 [Rubripirellula tenax]|uniref:SLA1 homology domain-containing protein n=1 Tax=Rubripirellula tenax TaxID=2528015 RepID=A0A5C6ECN7_9BACT|nr:SHD1 domain-containing protein [Rubripirellula tenax]TWU46214.1 hypothetical protein Poly51_56100 [Rubripirellula tenax]